jgi:RNA polymerase sigma factor for flagellar operon FliA
MATSRAVVYQEEVRAGESSRDELIVANLPLVRWIAFRIHDRLPKEFALDDLVSVGVLGLIAAIDSYDPAQNVKLSTYASYRIRGAIMDSIRGLDGIAPHHRKLVKQLQSAISSLEHRLQRQPDEEEIAAEMGLDRDEYQQVLLQTRGVTVGSLDSSPENSERSPLLNYLPASNDLDPARLFERSELKRTIAEGISKLPKVERQVLGLYYQENLGLKEIAELMHLHYSRISQLKTQAVMRLRALMEKKWPAQGGDYEV